MAWNKPTSNTVDATSSSRSSGRGKMPRLRPILAGMAVSVTLGALCLWMFSDGGDDTPKSKSDKDRGLIKEAKNISVTKQVIVKADETKVEEKSKYGTLVGCKTNETFGTACYLYRDEKGRVGKVYRSVRPRVFKHGTDQLLALALCHAEDRVAIPPMPISGNLDKQFRTSLNDPIVISPDDPEDIAEKKRIVIEGRERMKELLDGGATFAEVLADHRRLFNENAEIRNKAARDLQRLVDEGDTEGTREYLLKVNIALQQMGIKELEEPATTDQRRDKLAQERAVRTAIKENKTNEN